MRRKDCHAKPITSHVKLQNMNGSTAGVRTRGPDHMDPARDHCATVLPPRVAGMFYQAVVAAELLYGSET